MPKKKSTGRRRFGSPADVRNILRDYHLKNAGLTEEPKGKYCINCKLRIFLVQNKEGEQFYVTSVIRGQPQGKRWCRHAG